VSAWPRLQGFVQGVQLALERRYLGNRNATHGQAAVTRRSYVRASWGLVAPAWSWHDRGGTCTYVADALARLLVALSSSHA